RWRKPPFPLSPTPSADDWSAGGVPVPRRAPRNTSPHPQHDLPKMRARRHESMGFAGLSERQDARDRGPQTMVGERLAEARPEGRDDGGLVRHRTGAERRSDDRQTLHEELREIDLAPRAAHEPDQDQAPPGGERGQVLLEVGGADVIEDHVDAASAGELARPRGEVLLAIVDA